MSLAPHLFVALSGHGFGHLAQAAPVLDALRRRLPALRLTVQTSLSGEVLRARIAGELTHVPEATDLGMIMASALEAKTAESRVAYREFHADWERRLTRQTILLKKYAPDLVFADIPYLPLAAAAQVGLPAVALCSLNWADILEAYWPGDVEVNSWCKIILAAYNSAVVFLRPVPAMPMPALHNTREIGPIAALGQDRRAELNQRFGLPQESVLVVITLGGIDTALPLVRWPVHPGIYWIVPQAWNLQRPDCLYREQMADIPFIDLLRSSDLLLTKPGYGAFVEAVCNGKPVLYVDRRDWPETPYLVEWLRANGSVLLLSQEALLDGNLAAPVQTLLAQPRRPALPPEGIGMAADYLAQMCA
ncbi:MAG: hypothetical protein U1F76_25915 [Candidatus Competibacteraceae bacterium]